jgi:hypothetical protein
VAFDLFWSLATLLSVGVVAGVVLTSRTGGGKLVGGLAFGAAVVACLVAWPAPRFSAGGRAPGAG